MSICDASFVIRLLEFNIHRNTDPSEHNLTKEVEEELLSKDFSDIKYDLDRVMELNEDNNLDFSLIGASSFENSINWFVECSGERYISMQAEIQNCSDTEILNLDKGEKSCYFARNKEEYIFTEDFEAYNIIFSKTNGKVACLIEILADSDNLNEEKKDIIKALDALFLPEHQLESTLWSLINQKIESSLDDRIEIS